MSSSTTRALRTSARRAASCSRYASSPSTSAAFSTTAFSSQSKLDVQPKSTLPAEKMRILVDLYHRSETFITKANLSQAVDNAFLSRPQSRMMLSRSPEDSVSRLQVDRLLRDQAPKYIQARDVLPRRKHGKAGKHEVDWSMVDGYRARQVMATLYGTWQPGTARPSYDGLVDAQEAIKEELQEELQEDSAAEGKPLSG